MSSWDTKVVHSTLNTETRLNTLVDGRSNVRSGVSDGAAANAKMFGGMNFFAGGGYSIVGINANGIEDIRSEITNYVTRIQTYLEKIGEDAVTSTAFRGETAERAVMNYIDTVKLYCSNLISQLYVFDDKLSEVSIKWSEAQINMGENIDTSRTGYNEGQAYR